MKTQIQNRFTGEVIFESENQELKDAVCDAVRSEANLSGANLSRANLSGAKRNGKIIKHAAQWLGLYKYRVMAIIYEDGSEDVEMGCYTRSVENWKADFWNNPNEFTDPNSIESRLRLFAFETAVRWMEIIKSI